MIVRRLGRCDYLSTLTRMRAFTEARTHTTPDEIWLVEHPPVYTLGLGGQLQHILAPGSIAVVESDRGGQVTYHGPGQAIAYVLFDLGRRHWRVRALVWALEEAVIRLLAGYGVNGQRRTGAPGVYVDRGKIAALGLRVRRGCTYHGIALNVAMDLSPYGNINPCGYPGLAVTQMHDLDLYDNVDTVATNLAQRLVEQLEETVLPLHAIPACL